MTDVAVIAGNNVEVLVSEELVQVNIINAVFIPVVIPADYSKFKFNQPLIGVIDGDNNVFDLPDEIIEGTQTIFLNGVYQDPDFDYTIDGTEIVFTIAPKFNDAPKANYIKA